MSYRYLCTKQNADGTFDEVGMNNRTIISGYKSWSTALRYGVRRWAGEGRCVRVEVYYGDNVQGRCIEVFHTVT